MIKFLKKAHHALGELIERHEPRHKARHGWQSLPSHDEKKQIADIMSKLGASNALDYLYMLEAFISSEEHLSAEAFKDLLHEDGLNISKEECAQTLKLFASLGFAERHFNEGMEPIYEYVKPGGHHDHISCRSCGKLMEFKRNDVDDLIESITCENGFIHLNHRLVIQGICPKCRKMRNLGLPLTKALPGELVLVLRIDGDFEAENKLSSMGLRKGVRLKVTGEQSGSVVAMIDGVRLALGPELAEKVIVSQINTCFTRSRCKKNRKYCHRH